MRKKSFLILIATVIGFLLDQTQICAFAKSRHPKRLAINEIKLNQYQHEKISSDFPLSDVELVGKNSLIFIGKKHIWLLNVVNGALKKISMKNQLAPQSGYNPQITPLNNPDHFLISQNNDLLKLEVKPEIQLLKFELAASNERILAIGNLNLIPTVVTTNGIFRVTNANKLKLWSKLPQIPVTANQIIVGNEYIWLHSKHDIWKWEEASNKLTKIAKNIKDIENIRITVDRILIQTKYSIIALEKNGYIDQTIPVSSTRKLVLFDVRDNYHTFLFDDKQLEIYDSDKSEIKYTRLPVKRVKSVDRLIFSKGKIISILDGKLANYQLEGAW